MAYYVEIGQCRQQGCTRPVWAEVFAYRNDRMGRYCKRHAEERVKALTEAEATNPAGFR